MNKFLQKQTTHLFSANFNKNKERNQSGWKNKLVMKQGPVVFILVAPSNEYKQISPSIVFNINCCLSVPQIIDLVKAFKRYKHTKYYKQKTRSINK